MTDSDDRLLTSNCFHNRHRLCRCLEPGQDRLYAGVVLDLDTMLPMGWCECPCHEDDYRERFASSKRPEKAARD